MPNFSIYLYTCLFLFLTDVVLHSNPLSSRLSRSVPLPLAQDFSRRLKFMLSRVPGAYRVSSRAMLVLRRVTHTPEARTRTHRTHTRAQNTNRRAVCLFLSRAARVFLASPPEFDKFICLCGARDRATSRRHRRRWEIYHLERKARQRGPPRCDGFLSTRKRNCGPFPALSAESARVSSIFIGVRLVLKREKDGFVQSSDETKGLGDKKKY